MTREDDGAAAIARINANRAARGLPPIPEHDPDQNRAEWTRVKSAMVVALWALRSNDEHVAMATDIFAAEVNGGTDLLPQAVGGALIGHTTDPGARDAVTDAVYGALRDWLAADAPYTRGHVEKAVWDMTGAALEALSEVGVENLEESLRSHLAILAGFP